MKVTGVICRRGDPVTQPGLGWDARVSELDPPCVLREARIRYSGQSGFDRLVWNHTGTAQPVRRSGDGHCVRLAPPAQVEPAFCRRALIPSLPPVKYAWTCLEFHSTWNGYRASCSAALPVYLQAGPPEEPNPGSSALPASSCPIYQKDRIWVMRSNGSTFRHDTGDRVPAFGQKTALGSPGQPVSRFIKHRRCSSLETIRTNRYFFLLLLAAAAVTFF